MRKERKILLFVPQKLRKSFANGNPIRILFHFEEFNLNPERGITGISSLSCEKNVRNTLIVSFKNVI